MLPVRNVIILGAAGRDFHVFNTVFRGNAEYRVVAFTAAQIPNIAGRRYPPELAGPGYEKGIPIFPESELAELIEKHKVDVCVFAYSDVSHEEVMHKASIANAHGADFWLLGAQRTMLHAKKPVISVCAVRTGAGKSPASRYVATMLKRMGKKIVVIRHPMPYGELKEQVVQRFASMKDMDRQGCTLEEREEYERHIADGTVVYAGVDYERILREAEREADVLLWDGGNNDTPFVRPDLHIVVADPLRPGHELTYHPGETNVRMADVVVINKVNTADPASVAIVEQNIRKVNPAARIVLADSVITVDRPGLVEGKRVLVVEDGPTTTHGGMGYGAGMVAARKFGAREIVNAREYAVGSIRKIYEEYPHLSLVLPAMGYGREQMRELETTINRAECDAVVIGTPVDLRKSMQLNKPAARVLYELAPRKGYEEIIEKEVRKALGI